MSQLSRFQPKIDIFHQRRCAITVILCFLPLKIVCSTLVWKLNSFNRKLKVTPSTFSVCTWVDKSVFFKNFQKSIHIFLFILQKYSNENSNIANFDNTCPVAIRYVKLLVFDLERYDTQIHMITKLHKYCIYENFSSRIIGRNGAAVTYLQ